MNHPQSKSKNVDKSSSKSNNQQHSKSLHKQINSQSLNHQQENNISCQLQPCQKQLTYNNNNDQGATQSLNKADKLRQPIKQSMSYQYMNQKSLNKVRNHKNKCKTMKRSNNKNGVNNRSVNSNRNPTYNKERQLDRKQLYYKIQLLNHKQKSIQYEKKLLLLSYQQKYKNDYEGIGYEQNNEQSLQQSVQQSQPVKYIKLQHDYFNVGNNNNIEQSNNNNQLKIRQIKQYYSKNIINQNGGLLQRQSKQLNKQVYLPVRQRQMKLSNNYNNSNRQFNNNNNNKNINNNCIQINNDNKTKVNKQYTITNNNRKIDQKQILLNKLKSINKQVSQYSVHNNKFNLSLQQQQHKQKQQELILSDDSPKQKLTKQTKAQKLWTKQSNIKYLICLTHFKQILQQSQFRNSNIFKGKINKLWFKYFNSFSNNNVPQQQIKRHHYLLMQQYHSIQSVIKVIIKEFSITNQSLLSQSEKFLHYLPQAVEFINQYSNKQSIKTNIILSKYTQSKPNQIQSKPNQIQSKPNQIQSKLNQIESKPINSKQNQQKQQNSQQNSQQQNSQQQQQVEQIIQQGQQQQATETRWRKQIYLKYLGFLQVNKNLLRAKQSNSKLLKLCVLYVWNGNAKKVREKHKSLINKYKSIDRIIQYLRSDKNFSVRQIQIQKLKVIRFMKQNREQNKQSDLISFNSNKKQLKNSKIKQKQKNANNNKRLFMIQQQHKNNKQDNQIIQNSQQQQYEEQQQNDKEQQNKQQGQQSIDDINDQQGQFKQQGQLKLSKHHQLNQQQQQQQQQQQSIQLQKHIPHHKQQQQEQEQEQQQKQVFQNKLINKQISYKNNSLSPNQFKSPLLSQPQQKQKRGKHKSIWIQQPCFRFLISITKLKPLLPEDIATLATNKIHLLIHRYFNLTIPKNKIIAKQINQYFWYMKKNHNTVSNIIKVIKAQFKFDDLKINQQLYQFNNYIPETQQFIQQQDEDELKQKIKAKYDEWMKQKVPFQPQKKWEDKQEYEQEIEANVDVDKQEE